MYCDRAIIASGNNWKHLDGSYRCTFPFTEPGMAEPAPSYAAVIQALREQHDSQETATWADTGLALSMIDRIVTE